MQQESPLFADFCALLQTLSTQRGTEEKKKRLRRFIHTWRARYDDFLPAMRLLLPQVLIHYTLQPHMIEIHH
jgi:hypothetical protein